MISNSIKFNLERDSQRNDSLFTIESVSVGSGRYVVQTRCPSDFGQIEIEIEPYRGDSHFVLEWEVNEEEIPKEFHGGVIEEFFKFLEKKSWLKD